jgi:tetratricopeptide (TPR) repeat protein
LNQHDLELTNQLLAEGEPDEAMRICSAWLNEDPEDATAIFNTGRCYSMAGRHGLAALMYQKAVNLHPEDSALWNNLGHSYHTIGQYDRAEMMFQRSLELEPGNWAALNNMCALMATRIRPHEALEYGSKALFVAKEGADLNSIWESMSMPYLGLKNWKEGWPAYERGLPGKYRRERQYANEPRWDGRPGGKVVFYGEQGIGDEIMFASILPDVEDTVDAVIECDRRLEGLFKRTFPWATVHGTRFDKIVHWADSSISGRCAFGSLGKFYRNSTEAFPRKAYLETCPDRRKMYRTLLDGLKGKKIGIAWTGGTKTTRTDHRSMVIEDVEKLASRYPEVSFISLEYKDTGSPKGVHEFPFITRTNDYDDTAALVAELDGVISVTTAVALLAGAVGTECHVLVPQEPTWHWGYEGEMPWFPLKLHRGKWDMDAIMSEILEMKEAA